MPVDFIEFEITDLTGSYLVEIGKVDRNLLPLNIQKGDVACIGQCQVLWRIYFISFSNFCSVTQDGQPPSVIL